MCGPSNAQKTAQAQEMKISDLLTSDMQLIAGTNMNILNSMMTALSPGVQKGPNQFGFSPEQEAAQRTLSMETSASAGRNTANAVRGALASQGGGTNYMPSGSAAAIESGLAENIAQKEAEAQLGITEKGYEVGRENFFDSAKLLGAAPAGLEGPITQAGSAAMGAAEGSMAGATQMQQASDAWMAPLAGIVGGVGGMALGKMIPQKTT